MSNISTGYARSEALKSEWSELKKEMISLAPDSERRQHIHERMDDIMKEMADVLTETRAQYSPRKLHVICRTYDSSEDEDEMEKGMIEGKNVEHRGIRHSFIKGFKEKLRKPDAPKEKKVKRLTVSPMSPKGKPLSVEDREQLSLEQSRLERESRRIKRKPLRSPVDDSRLVDIANRLSCISSTLAEMPPQVTLDPGNTSPCSPAHESWKQAQQSLPTSNDSSFDYDNSISSTIPTKTPAKQAAKRKKGWATLEAGVASFRALGRTMRSNVTPKENIPKTNAKTKPANVFADTAERLNERGEILYCAADATDQMANDTGDMLAAVSALRQRNQKGGFFS